MAWYDGLLKFTEPYLNGPKYKEDYGLCSLERDQDQHYIQVLKGQLSSWKEKYEIMSKQPERVKTVFFEPKKPDYMDAEFWNKKFDRRTIHYKAPTKLKVIEYLRDVQYPEVETIVDSLISDHSLKAMDVNSVPGIVMLWRDQQLFDVIGFKYKLDKGEVWSQPDVVLKRNYGDCDDVGTLEYYLIRRILQKLGVWQENKHRLKCIDGHAFGTGTILKYAGRHFYLVWLHQDGEWYTVESTFYRGKDRRKFGKTPHRKDDMYGPINYTFNEYASWAQRRFDYERGFDKK